MILPVSCELCVRLVFFRDIPELRMGGIDNMASYSIRFRVSNNRRDQSRDSFLVHVDHIIVDLDEDRLGIEAFRVGPELWPWTFQVVDFDV